MKDKSDNESDKESNSAGVTGCSQNDSRKGDRRKDRNIVRKWNLRMSRSEARRGETRRG